MRTGRSMAYRYDMAVIVIGVTGTYGMPFCVETGTPAMSPKTDAPELIVPKAV